MATHSRFPSCSRATRIFCVVEHEQLLGGVGEVVLPANDVGDPGVEVVDGDREVVERASRPPGRSPGRPCWRWGSALGRGSRRRRPSRPCRGPAGGPRRSPRARPGTPGRHRGAPCTPGHRRRWRSSGTRGRSSSSCASASRWRSARSDWKIGPSSQSELQPPQRVEDLLDVLGSRSLAVGIFDAQHERAALPLLAASQQPVVEGSAGAADVQRASRGWSKANAHERDVTMLIGAHVSNAGGLTNAVERGTERGCEAIQIFNQSPRMWRPTHYTDDDIAEFREAIDASKIDAVLIHAVYLLNCASEDTEIRDKSLASLIQSLRVGEGSARSAWCCTPARPSRATSARRSPAPARSSRRRWPRRTSCPLHLEDTAGAGGTLGRSFEELERLLDASGADKRLGVCLDSCHLLASGYEVRTADGLTDTLDDSTGVVGHQPAGLAARQRLGHPAGLQPRPPRGPRPGRVRREGLRHRSCPSRASTSSRACSRPGPTRARRAPTTSRSRSS